MKRSKVGMFALWTWNIHILTILCRILIAATNETNHNQDLENNKIQVVYFFEFPFWIW